MKTRIERTKVYSRQGVALSKACAMITAWLALQDASAEVVGWGSASSSTNVPADVGDVVALAAGPRHNYALRADGTVWGDNCIGRAPTNMNDAIAVAGSGMAGFLCF